MTLALRERRASNGRADRVLPPRPGSSGPAAPAISQRRIWVRVLAVWAISRAFFFVFGAIGHEAVRQSRVRGLYPEPLGALSYWAHWDGRWLAHIATSGYDTDAATAFFPLYPLVLRLGVEAGFGVALIGVAISTLATLAALYFVFAIANAWYGERAALAAIVTLAFFPDGFLSQCRLQRPALPRVDRRFVLGPVRPSSAAAGRRVRRLCGPHTEHRRPAPPPARVRVGTQPA